MARQITEDTRILAMSPANPAPTSRLQSDRPAVADGPTWAPTPALRRALVATAAPLLLAVLLGRTDLVVLALPFALGLAAALARLPKKAPEATVTVDEDCVVEGETTAARVTIDNPDEVDVAVAVATEVSPQIRLRHGVGTYVRSLPAGRSTEVTLEGTALRWGIHRFGPAQFYGVACDGMLRTQVVRTRSRPVRVYPSAELFDSRVGMPRAAGMAGIHRSRKLGDGGELAEVRQYQPGDRLRRIDWRTSMRQRELYVNTTLSERDADVVLVMDVLHDAGAAPGQPTIMDITVRAVAALAEHYAHQGDRVSIVEFGSRMRRMRPGTGRRHYLAARHWLTDTRVSGGMGASMERCLRGAVAPGAVVVMLTPLIDHRSTDGLARLARTGHPLLTVDTLPGDVSPRRGREWSEVATRLWRLGRANTVDRLRELGVPVEPWRGPGSLDRMLRHVARLDRAPKAASR